MLSQVEQSHTLHLALDYDRKPWMFNVGFWRRLNDAGYRFKLTTIVEIPFCWRAEREASRLTRSQARIRFASAATSAVSPAGKRRRPPCSGG